MSVNIATAQTDYRSINNGNWSTVGIWEENSGSGWGAATTYPGQSGAPGTVTIRDDVTLDLQPISPANIVVNNGAQLVNTGNPSLNLSGALTLNAFGASMTFTGTGSLTAGSVSIGAFGSSLTFNSSGTFTVSGNFTLGALVSSANIDAGNFFLSGNMSVGGGSFMTFSTTGNVTVGGTTTIAALGFVTDDEGTGTSIFTGLVTNAGFWTSTAVSIESRMVFRGGINNSLTFAGGGATFDTNNQTISGAGTTAFANLVSIPAVTVTNNGVVDMTSTGAGVLNGAGTWTQGTGTLDYSGSTLTITTFNASNTGNTVDYDGAAQTVRIPTTTSYYNLSASGSGTKTYSADVDVDNDLSISGSATLSATGIVDVDGDLTISGTAVLNADANAVDIDGDITLSNTGTLGGTGNVNVGGNWTTNTSANYTEGSRTLTFDGTGNQVISITTSPEQFSNLTINKASGNVSLDNSPSTDLTITGVATFTNGILYGSANETVTFNAGSSVGATDSNSFIDAPVTKIGNTAFTFPIGTNLIWRRFGFTPSGADAATSITVRYIWSTPPNSGSIVAAFTRISAVEYWTLLRSGTLGNGSTVTLYWEDGGHSAITQPSSLLVGRWQNTGTRWQNAGAGSITGTATAGTITSNGITAANISTATRNYTFATNAALPENPLPIELINFTADLENDRVELKWATASETGNHFFTVERAANIENFEAIGENIPGAGTTNERRDYQTVDETPLYGRSYYRLRQTDFDGKFTYSDVQVVDYEGPKFASLRVYPNPSGGTSFTVLVTGLKEQAAVPLQIYNVQGQLVYNGTVEVNTPGTLKHEIEFGNPLRSGIYLIKAGPTLQLTQKIFIE